jgi:hypothetical protein
MFNLLSFYCQDPPLYPAQAGTKIQYNFYTLYLVRNYKGLLPEI